MIRITYVDDTPTELRRYGERLSSSETTVRAIAPPKEFDPDAVLATPADVFVLDYELDKVARTYEGATLATAIRTRMNEHPIVLLSKKSLVAPESARPLRLLFDDIIFKDELEKSAAAVRARLCDLAEGFARLRRKRRRDVRTLFELLASRVDDESAVQRASPPLIAGEDGTARWAVREVASWIRNQLLFYPGIVYEPLSAATMLGIASASLKETKLVALLEDARYGGIFSGPAPLWWRSRLLSVAQETIAASGTAPTSAQVAFAAAFEKVYGVKLKRSVCVSCDGAEPEDVCYVLQKPVHIAHSLPYRPDGRSSAMDEARVSFKAIRETDKVLDEYLDDEDRLIAERLRDADE